MDYRYKTTVFGKSNKYSKYKLFACKSYANIAACSICGKGQPNFIICSTEGAVWYSPDNQENPVYHSTGNFICNNRCFNVWLLMK